ncbi:thioredoxin-like protein [Phlyctochytrium arcticum]|nr:thioredoxin-like protein [Phlyctochytrium arcticum]
MGLRLGDIAPDFTAQTTFGSMNFHDWKQNSWAILFSHPEDFTPVCTTELGAVAKLEADWQKRGVKVVGLSCDSLERHEQWIADINSTQKCTVNFPIIADSTRQVAQLYDMLDHQDPTNIDSKGLPLTVRSVFIVDPANKIRLTLTYPAAVGRNFDEILRCVDAVQLGDRKRVATPANWKVGEQVIVHNAVGDEEAEKLFGDVKKVLPYLRLVNTS